MHTEVGGDLFDRHTLVAVASHPQEVVAEFSGIGPGLTSSQPTRPCKPPQMSPIHDEVGMGMSRAELG
jgi:hypothetical protein